MQNTKFNVGNRVKVKYKTSYSGDLFVRGEILKISDSSIEVLGFEDKAPHQLKVFNVFKDNIIELSATRIDKIRSEAITKYVKLYHQQQTIKKKRRELELQQQKIEMKQRNLAANVKIPDSLATPSYVLDMVFKEMKKTSMTSHSYGKGSVRHEPGSNYIYHRILVSDRIIHSKYLGTDREYDGQVFMWEHTEKDVLKHLAEDRHAKIRKHFDLKFLEKFFKVDQEFVAEADHHNDETFNIDYTLLLTIKNNVKVKDVKEIAKQLKRLTMFY